MTYILTLAHKYNNICLQQTFDELDQADAVAKFNAVNLLADPDYWEVLLWNLERALINSSGQLTRIRQIDNLDSRNPQCIAGFHDYGPSPHEGFKKCKRDGCSHEARDVESQAIDPKQI